jgi:hypothetical protein
MSKIDPLVDAVELAKILGIKTGTIWMKFREGLIPGYEVSGNRLRFSVEEVLASIRAKGRSEQKARGPWSPEKKERILGMRAAKRAAKQAAQQNGQEVNSET